MFHKCSRVISEETPRNNVHNWKWGMTGGIRMQDKTTAYGTVIGM
jgi:hypothetical protein